MSEIDTKDIVKRLRANTHKYTGFQNLNTEAADEIDRLRSLVEPPNGSAYMLAQETIRRLTAENAAMKEAMSTCSGSCHNSLRALTNPSTDKDHPAP